MLSLMSTAACASSSSEMSSVLPLSAAWCRAENLGTGLVSGATALSPPQPCQPLPSTMALNLHLCSTLGHLLCPPCAHDPREATPTSLCELLGHKLLQVWEC